MEKQKTLFDLDLLYNPIWEPTEEDKGFMNNNSWQELFDEWQEAEDKVLYTNVRVNYDSCDCWDGYGCSHGSYPTDIDILDDKDCNILVEEEGLYFKTKKNWLSIGDIRYNGFTIQDFERCCELVGIVLKYKTDSRTRIPTPETRQD